jgi:alpha-beta hydrolase superfamily lysophospholipase
MAIKYIKGINHHIAYKTDRNSYLEDVGKWRGKERGMKKKG